jgi:hypothetical protein
MIRMNTVFDILDGQIIRLFYKKKYAVKIRVIHVICVLITLWRQPFYVAKMLRRAFFF